MINGNGVCVQVHHGKANVIQKKWRAVSVTDPAPVKAAPVQRQRNPARVAYPGS